MSDQPEQWIERFEWQGKVFADRPQRGSLLKLRASWERRAVGIRVQRNMPFEYILRAATPFLSYAGLQAIAPAYSDYDDSLGLHLEGDADVEVVALDFERYRSAMTIDDLVVWLDGRLRALRGSTRAPILVLDWAANDPDARRFNHLLRSTVEPIADVRVADNAAVAHELDDAYHDDREAQTKGMALSEAAVMLTAQRFGLVWLPALLAPRLKALVLDFDNTLYYGVLGEDGVDGVKITDAHRAIYEQVRRLSAEGVYIAGLSRNEEADVLALLDQRDDLPFDRATFSALVVDWEGKASGIVRIAEQLRIGTDAIVFVDDNPGELAAVGSAVPAVHLLHAADPAITAAGLRLLPRLNGYPTGTASAIRASDLAASAARDQAAAVAADPGEYLRSLDIRLTFRLDDPTTVRRIAELSGKTNQFNTHLLRLSEADIAARRQSEGMRHVAVSLVDKLSDSGVIGAVVGHQEDGAFVLDEAAVSCRALGRDLEDAIIWHAIELMAGEPGGEVIIPFRRGERNGPALRWVERWAAVPSGAEGIARVSRGPSVEEAVGAAVATLVDEPVPS